MSFRRFFNKARNKEHKYGAKKLTHAGYSFSSKLEAAVFDILKLREKAGEISDIEVQQRVYLTRDTDIYYIPDFRFLENGSRKYAEAKGFETPEWKLKRKLFIHHGDAPLEIWGGSYTRPKLVETIYPKGK